MWFKNLNRYYIVFGVCIVLGLLFHKDYITEFPSYVHAWAQADHYAITLGFLDNGLNFFKPQTLIYNHQFPDWWASTTETGITSVDFPLHHYIPAVIMEIIDVRLPIVSRLYIFLYSLIGLFSVYKIAYFFSENHLRSLFVTIFAATSPVFVYYQAGFFPSIPSLSNTLLGIWFYISYLKNARDKYFYIGIVLVTLAALSRTTFVIPLIAIFGNEFLRVVLKKTGWKSKIIPTLCSIAAILGYFLYNKYLRETYSSIFIGYLLPPESIVDFWNVLKEIFGNWFWQYYSKYHIGFLTVLIIGLYINRKQISIPKPTKQVLWFIAILCFGLFLFLIAMAHAFIHHDYYFLDTFYVPLILLLSMGCAYFPKVKSKMLKRSIYALTPVLIVLFCTSVITVQKNRRIVIDYDLATNTKISYEGAKDYLTSLGISDKAKILAIDICAPNVPFVMMDRRGHGVFYPTKENIEKAFKWDFDYVVTQNGYFLDRTYNQYPDILNYLTVIGNNGRITVSKYHKEKIPQTLNDYLLNGLSQPYYKAFCDYEDKPSEKWSNVVLSDTSIYDNHIGVMKPTEKYGITIKDKSIKGLLDKSSLFKLTAKVYVKKGDMAKFALDVVDNGNSRVSKIFLLSDYLDVSKTDQWQNIEMLTMIPKLNSDNNLLSLFLWNPEADHLYLDDVRVELY